MTQELDRVNFTEAPQRVFKSLSQYKRVRANIIRALANGRCNKDVQGDSYIFDRLKVEFSTKYKAEEIWLDHVNGHIILEAPQRKNESRESLKARRMEYHSILLKQVEVMTSIGITIIYLLLDDRGRKQVDKAIKNKKVIKRKK